MVSFSPLSIFKTVGLKCLWLGSSPMVQWLRLPLPMQRIRVWSQIWELRGFPSDSAAKNLPALQKTQETWVRSLGGEGTLVEEMATHPSILTWRTPWTEELGRLQPIGSQRVRQDLSDWAHTHALEAKIPCALWPKKPKHETNKQKIVFD